MSKLFLQLGITLSIGIVAIFMKNFEIIKWWFVNPNESYVATNGVIIDSKIVHTGVHGGWKFIITYEYSIGNIKYTSDRVHFGIKHHLKNHMLKVISLNIPKAKK